MKKRFTYRVKSKKMPTPQLTSVQLIERKGMCVAAHLCFITKKPLNEGYKEVFHSSLLGKVPIN